MASVFDNSSSKKSILGNSNQVSPILGGPAAASTPKGQQPQQGPAASGSYNNLSSYIKANQGNNLANRLVNQSQKQADQAQADIDKAKSDFDTSTATNVGAMEQTGSDAASAIAPVMPPPGAKTFKMNEPKITEPTQAEKDAVANAMTGTYRGPSSLGNQPALNSSVQNLGNMAGNVNSESGRFALLRQLMGRQGYNRGQQILDQGLLQGDSQQLQSLNAIKRQSAETSRNLEDVTGQVANEVQKNTQRAGEIARTIKDKGDTEIGSLISGIESRLKETNKGRDETYGRVGTDIDNDTLDLSPETLSLLGIDPNQALYNLNLKDYIAQGAGLTKEMVATPQEFAKYQRLAGLMGRTPDYLKGKPDEQAKTQDGAVKFNKEQFLKDVGTRGKALEETLTNNQGSFSINESANSIINNTDWNNPHTAREALWGLINSVGRNLTLEGTNLDSAMRQGEAAKDGRMQSALYRRIADVISRHTKDSADAYRTAKSEKDRVINKKSGPIIQPRVGNPGYGREAPEPTITGTTHIIGESPIEPERKRPTLGGKG